MAKDTVGSAVRLMDEYLSVHSVSTHELQQLSLVSLSVASKMHETQPISMDEMEVLSENKFSRKTLWQVEAQLMRVADWRLDPPTAFTMARDLVAALDSLHRERGVMTQLMSLLQSATEGANSTRLALQCVDPERTCNTIAACFVALWRSDDRDRCRVCRDKYPARRSERFAPRRTVFARRDNSDGDYGGYMLDLRGPGIQGVAAPTPKLLVGTSDAGSRSPCSVDTDGWFCEDACSPTWMVDIRACLEAAALRSVPKRLVVDAADGATRAPKREPDADAVPSVPVVMIDPAEALDMLLQQETREGRVQRNPQYLTAVQSHGMKAHWRHVICKWMFETGSAFKLAKDTVGCAIFFMDQYLSVSSVDKIMLQLLSMVCMYVASKMHESQPISMDEMDLLSQRKFSRKEICTVESELVTALAWRLAPPMSFTFARDFIQTLDVPEQQELQDEAFAFLVTVTQDYNSLQFKNSSVGISAVHVIWNARRLRPSTVIKDAIRSLDLDSAEFVSCYRWLLELYHSQHQHHPRFVSVDESKVDQSRSISPTSVDDLGAVCHSGVAAAAGAAGTSGGSERPAESQAPSAKRRLDSSSPGCDSVSSSKKSRRNACA
ncbi:hypothetical protein PybrP1_012741 [[Pythium] brassicae (nom. inval.)]|nr:hypothetical protein PybrP1_012741 [[Pythium] brassicae (nom. inval.)]